jgi:hypothetical protein
LTTVIFDLPPFPDEGFFFSCRKATIQQELQDTSENAPRHPELVSGSPCFQGIADHPELDSEPSMTKALIIEFLEAPFIKRAKITYRFFKIFCIFAVEFKRILRMK